ncbi:alpha-galactosidase [Fodinicola feengrottensis]|uniref:alpha-galactosidase n=1 Tax=Fodinicola feengrottensis TaxID=435914 RepID=UPI002442C384|nr:alpha-galactosidase [Fodinicola feengrottensis]
MGASDTHRGQDQGAGGRDEEQWSFRARLVSINLDDFYQKCDANGFQVDGNGRWLVDPAKFPNGIKALADYVHGLGLKFGFYVTPGIAQNAVTANTPVAGTSYHAKDIADTSKKPRRTTTASICTG